MEDHDLSHVAVLYLGPPMFPGGMLDTLKKTVTLLSAEEAEKRSDEVKGIVACPGFGAVDTALLDRYSSVSVVSTYSVGYNHIDVTECTKRGVKVGHTPNVVNGATADMAWSLLLSTARQIVLGHNKLREPNQRRAFRLMGKEVHGSTLGIVGMGRIGLEIARRAVGFSMKVLYHNRSRRAEEEERSVSAEYVADLDKLLGCSDFVVNVLPSTAETKQLFGREKFYRMRNGAVFVNVGRGLTVDHDALAEALSSGKLFGAGLDVTDPEPLPRDHPLMDMENVVIAPHIGTGTVETRIAMAELMIGNLVHGLKGKPMKECVNP